MAYAPVQQTLSPEIVDPEVLDMRRRMAMALLGESMNGEPVEHWLEGAGQIAQALLGGMQLRKADKQEAEGRASGAASTAAIVDMLMSRDSGGGAFAGGSDSADLVGGAANDTLSGGQSGPRPSSPAGGARAASGDAAYVYNGMLKRGLNPAQAAAWTASVKQESNFNPNAHNKGEGARGTIQWRADRLRNLQNFAAKRGKPWNDIDTQMDFGLWEMQNTEREAGQMFRAAQTPEQANQALKRYIRYGDKAGPAGSAGWDYRGRLASTRRILDALGGGSSSDALSGGAAADTLGSYLGAGTPPQKPAGPPQSMPRTLPPQPQEMQAQPVQPLGMYFAPQPEPPPRPLQDMMPARQQPLPPPSAQAGVPPGAPQSPVPMQAMARPRPAPPPQAMASAAPPAPMVGQQAPMAGPPMPPPAPRMPQPRPEPAVVATHSPPAAPAMALIPPPGQPAHVPMPAPGPAFKNDYASVPGQRPATPPMRPGQLMAEPYSGPMSAQEFARQGQAAMRARNGGQEPQAQQPAQPRQGIMQALLGRGGSSVPAQAQAAPAGFSGAGGGQREQIAAMLSNPYVPDGVKTALLQQMMPQGMDPIEVGDSIVDANTGRVIYQAPQRGFSGTLSPGQSAFEDGQEVASVPPEQEAYTLSPGSARFVDGQQVASVPDKPPEQPSAVREYEFAKSQGFAGTFQDWEASKKGGMSLQVDPETGAVIFQQGGNIRPMTEAQSKDTVYATRAEGSLKTLDEFGGALTSFGETAAGSLGKTGNYLKSEEFQQAEQAGREFLAAVLRKDTGAAVTQQEMEIYGSTYLPEPGNGPKVLEQKRVSRRRALEALKSGMPAQAILAQENALRRTDAAAETAPTAPAAEGSVPEDVTPEEWEAMSPEDRALWQ
jgi:hypothetical protein